MATIDSAGSSALRSIHVGLIPDGNRRWAKNNRIGLVGVVRHHLQRFFSLFYTMSTNAEFIANQYGLRIDELTIYTLSRDNLEKRHDDTQMILYMLLGFMVCSFLVVRLLSPGSGDILFRWEDAPLDSDDCVCRVAISRKALDKILVILSILNEVVTASSMVEIIGGMIRLHIDDDLNAVLPPTYQAMFTSLSKSSESSCMVHISLDTDSPHASITFHPGKSQLELRARFQALAHTMSQIRFEVLGEIHLLPENVRGLLNILVSRPIPTHPPARVIRFALAYDPCADMASQLRHRTVSDVDMVVRTSGEIRTSGFLPVQTLYSEWVFESKLFPDFGMDDFYRALEEFLTRCPRRGA